MKTFPLVTILILAVSAAADCGCLKCGKNLRVVSPPHSPVTVVYRGEPCHYRRPIPYRIEVPEQESGVGLMYPMRTYGYRVQEMKVRPQPIHQSKHEPILYKHGFKVEVPQPSYETPDNYKQYRYFINLVAKPDRVVLPTPEGPRLPKPCSDGPIIEYLPKPESHEHHHYVRHYN